MTEVEIDVGDGPAPEQDSEQASPDLAPRPGESILGSLHAEVAEVAEAKSKVLPVGKIGRLYASYRPLGDDEKAELERKLKLRNKVSRGRDEADQELEQAAVLLAASCEHLIWIDDDGREVPLHELLEVPGPLRYNAELIEVLDLRGQLAEIGEHLGARPSSVEVVTALHRWGRGHAPLLTTARLLNMWMGGVSVDAIEGVFEGS